MKPRLHALAHTVLHVLDLVSIIISTMILHNIMCV